MRRRAKVTGLFLFVLLVPAFALPVAMGFSRPVENVTAVVTGALYVAALVALRRGRWLDGISVFVTVSVMLTHFSTAFGTTGSYGLVQPWMLLGPLYAMLQLGARAGWFATAALLVGATTLFFAERAGLYVPPVAPPYLIAHTEVFGYLLVVPVLVALSQVVVVARGAEQRELIEKARLEEEAERQLEQRRLVANLAHEIANPLSAAQLSADFLSGEPLEGEVGEATKEVSVGLARISALLGDLRLINNLPLRGMKPLSFAAVTSAAVAPMQQRLGARATVKLDDGVQVDGLAAELERLVRELVKNAEAAVSPEGRVEVSLTRIGRQAVLTVSDDGRGIARELQESLFSPFAARTSPREGRGLGLPIARAIVVRHGGRLTLESEPGKGTRVVARLPLSN